MYTSSSKFRHINKLIKDRVFPSLGQHTIGSQLPHSYYFTTRILVLKFVNKGVFFEEIQNSHFPRKGGHFGTHIREFGEKGVNFDVQCFTVKMGVHLVWKVKCFTTKKGVHFALKSQCFTTKKGSFWSEKSVFCRKKGGNFQTGEQGWVPLFSVSEGAGNRVPWFIHCYPFQRCILLRDDCIISQLPCV